MADDEEETDEPAVELGEGPAVEGAPVARVASRLTWPADASEVERKEGESVLRTPDGPRALADVLADSDVAYFDSRRSFVAAVEDVTGSGPVATDG